MARWCLVRACTTGRQGVRRRIRPGVLASFNPQPAPLEDSSIVGVWTFDDPSAPEDVAVFMADGTYVGINGDGFERGLYTFDGNALTFTTLGDTNGSGGFPRTMDSVSRRVAIVGDTLCFEGRGGWTSISPAAPAPS